MDEVTEPPSDDSVTVSISTVAAVMYGSSFGLFFLLVFFLVLLRVAPSFSCFNKDKDEQKVVVKTGNSCHNNVNKDYSSAFLIRDTSAQTLTV